MFPDTVSTKQPAHSSLELSSLWEPAGSLSSVLFPLGPGQSMPTGPHSVLSSSTPFSGVCSAKSCGPGTSKLHSGKSTGTLDCTSSPLEQGPVASHSPTPAQHCCGLYTVKRPCPTSPSNLRSGLDKSPHFNPHLVFVLSLECYSID